MKNNIETIDKLQIEKILPKKTYINVKLSSDHIERLKKEKEKLIYLKAFTAPADSFHIWI